MKILLVNDDGVFAPGINALAKSLKKEHEIYISAPMSERSGFSQSVTYLAPFEVKKVTVPGNEDVPAYGVSGSPADCAKFGIREVVNWDVDLVVSGINDGLNVGVDIYYSGTVGGATEAAMFGIPAIAFSQCKVWKETTDFTYAADFALDFIREFDVKTLPTKGLININFPKRPQEEGVRGVKITHQGALGYQEQYELIEEGEIKRYQLRGHPFSSDEENSDVWAIYNGYISISPLKYDRTDREFAKQLGRFTRE